MPRSDTKWLCCAAGCQRNLENNRSWDDRMRRLLCVQEQPTGGVRPPGAGGASKCQREWPDQTLDHRSGCPRCR